MTKEQQTQLALSILAQALKNLLEAQEACSENANTLLQLGYTDEQIQELLQAYLKQHDPETLERAAQLEIDFNSR